MSESGDGPVTQDEPDGALDWQALQALREELEDPGDTFLRRLVAGFEEHSAEAVAAMHDAARRGDRQGLRLAAHSLKGSSAQLGGTRLPAMCAQLEHDDSPPDELSRRIHLADAELGRLRAELRRFLVT
ncbi:MAG TPA: Hpt domain-containing protein [Intrasporangium sp.]|uniref:Hpt domain-containing protein n=1 Tax=Intrasporangium sp. TaxID=1925024 RepID=UPI002D790314|nr:Hpt domain-containing protein [Intrasporangium sp.]HET7398680.1 Hpt domain-containing protein [Intrasporangium sp.]